MASLKLNQGMVAKVVCPEGRGKVEITDSVCKGLFIEVRQTGGKTFYLRYTNNRSRQTQYRIGDANVLSLSQARLLAGQTKNKIAMGQDPCEQKALLRQIPTFAKFVEEQYLPYVKTYKRSWDTDVSLLKNHLLPRFGSRPMDTISRQDIQRMHHERRASGGAAGSANRLLILIRFIYNLAIRWGVSGISSNPSAGVPMFELNNKKERYLSVEEAQRLYASVCQSENPMLQYIVPMLILTGARKREVLDAKWQDFDQARRLWRIPMTKSGKARHVPLSDGALQVLASTPEVEGCEWVFANPKTLKPFVSIFYAWDTARKRAGLSEVRIHDLRHSFASLLVNSGRTLYEVQNILGHTQVKTTQRYAHLSQDTLLDAANAATRAVGAVMMPVNKISPAQSLHIC
jgi:integrase